MIIEFKHCFGANESRTCKGADLEEDSLSVDSPEVGDRITAVPTTRQQLQSGIAAWTQLL